MAYYLNFQLVYKYIPDFLKGLGLGLYLAAISLFIGMILGILLAFCAISRHRWLRNLSGLYVTILRNVPLLVLIFICYFGLPDTGLILSKHASFVTALSLYAGAYLTCLVKKDAAAAGSALIQGHYILHSFFLSVNLQQKF